LEGSGIPPPLDIWDGMEWKFQYFFYFWAPFELHKLQVHGSGIQNVIPVMHLSVNVQFLTINDFWLIKKFNLVK
jgi:hypothetical protein